MKAKKRNINVLVENNVHNESLKVCENIKNLINLLKKYASHNDLDDISDFLASSYKRFLIDSIYEEIKYSSKRDLNDLIYICLEIIKNNHKTFKHQNIYFICLNTLFLLINKADYYNVNFNEFLLFKNFLDLVSQNEWTEDNHIQIFAKLNYINLFIISNFFKKYISNGDNLDTLSFKKIINNTSIRRYVEGEENFIKNRSVYNKNELNSYIDDDNLKIENYFYFNSLIRNNNIDKTSSEIAYKHLNSEITYKDNEKRIYKKIKIINCKNNIKRSIFCINKKFVSTMDISSDDLILKIYKTVINLVIKYDLTIYIIYECINIILNLYKLQNKELIALDFLSIYKFYIKNDKKSSERYITFIILLITKCKNEYQKSFFLKLIKSFNSLLYLLNTENSDLRMYTKEALLTLKFLNLEFNNKVVSQEKSAHILRAHNNLYLENEFIRIMNLIFFHLHYIYDVHVKQKIDTKTRELKYVSFFKNIGVDPFLKNYIDEEIKIKKEKLFFNCNNIFNKNIIIKNNITEVENMVKTFDCFFIFLHNMKWHICFIFFFINTLSSVKKINKGSSSIFSKEFFFLIKNLFIQATYVFENLEKLERTKIDEDINAIIESIYVESEVSYNKNKILLFKEKQIKKMIENIKARSKLRNVNSFFILLEDLYFIIIDFLMPKKKKWIFFDSSNFYFFKKLLLRISYFYFKNIKCEQFIQIFFFESFFSRIKEKIKFESHNKKMDLFIFQKALLNYKKYDKYLSLKSRYISREAAAYFIFCLDFLKTVILFDEKTNNILKKSSDKKRIINFCKVQLLKYKFFLSSKTSNNCFSLSINVLYNLYLNIYINKRNSKLLYNIILIILLSTKKSLNSIKKDNVIFYTSDFVKSKKDDKSRVNTYTTVKEINNLGNKETKDCIVITNNFEKPFEEYYLNNSLHIFTTCLNVLTNIIKLSIIKYKIRDKNIIIKKSKIKKQKKKQYKYLKNKSSIISINYKYIRNLCHYILKRAHKDFFYNIRKYVLNFIQHFISLNVTLILKYKFKNNLNLKKILDLCFYNIYTDYDLNVFSLIYSIAFLLKKYITLCATKIKKANYYLILCDDLIFQILDQYYTYDYPSTNLWEEYISKLVSFDSLKHTTVDCPGE